MRLSEIQPLLKNPCRSGNGFSALCPCHDDKRRSLSVWETTDGHIRVQCHAGCDFREIKAIYGLDRNGRQNMPEKEIVKIYDYTDEKGNLLFQAVRYSPKDFKQRRPDGNGDWIWNLKVTRKVLYRLPELQQAEFLYVVEGEKDVETLRSQGEIATCCPMGAGKWRSEYSESLRGKTVAIVPDNDEPGRKHAEQVAQSLYGIAKEILMIEIPQLPEKGDVTDFFNAGGDMDLIRDWVARAESWKPKPEKVFFRQADKFRFTPLSELVNEPEEDTSFLWENTLPIGGFSICSAKPKVGKSTLARNLAVAVSCGEPFLNRQTIKGKVLYLCLEEKRSEIVKHFRALQSDTADILVHTGTTPENALDELAIAIAEHTPQLVIIDPLSRVLRVRDFNDYGGMARGLEPLIDLARKMDCHIMALHHDGKMERTGGDGMLGSTALFGAVDCHIQLKKREKGRTIATIQRYGEDLPETVIDLDKESGLITAQGDLESYTLKQAEDSILEVFKNNEELSEAQIKERINGFTQGTISKALRELVNENLIEKSGEGKRGKPFIYSKL